MSTPKEKIHLFMSLFKGREDVYAKRFEKKDGKGGYSPVCMNEWKSRFVISLKLNVHNVKIENIRC